MWPVIPVAEWADTRDTLHLYTQVIGKIRLAHEPLANHWWNIPLYLTARGLTTSPMPYPGGRAFSIDLDLVDHRLDVVTAAGTRRAMALGPRTVSEFHRELTGLLGQLDIAAPIWTMPVEIPDAIPFERDDTHGSYDADAVRRFWEALLEIERVLKRFRGGFVGKASPIHLFWGALDLAHTRFSGRPAPPHPGGAPNCGPHVMLEAYSHEVSSCGYWPGGPGAEGIFYAYAYPDPDRYRDHPVEPAGARWDDGLGEFVLPYELVRAAPDPDAALLAFFRSTYEAAAITGGWDRAALEHGTHPHRAPRG